MSGFAALLRRLADRLDPQGAVAPAPVADNVEAVPEYGPLSVVRERQEERLHELQYLVERSRDHDPDSGLLWFETWQLDVLARLLQHEIELRERQLAKLLDGGCAGA